MELKPHKLEKIILFLILLTSIHLCYPLLLALLQNIFLSHQDSTSKNVNYNDEIKCEIFKGEWVPNDDHEGPYYTNTTCWAIHDHQNCMKYGRPDSDFINWKWKPHNCELSTFDPLLFLDIVRGKSMAFIGDSVGRNHMQSLICLLSKVEYPIDVSTTSDEQFKTWIYPSYNFTMATFWSPYLVKSEEANTNGPTHTGLFNLYLDEPDPKWTANIQQFDYLIINAGHWFFRPSIYYQNNQIIGCKYCLLDNVTNLPMTYAYKRAFRTAFRAINENQNYKGITFLRTFAPSHFENGEWDKGGNCIKTRPLRSNETKVEGVNLEFYEAQLEEFKVGQREGLGNNKKYRVIDSTRAMNLRADGHPSKYGHWANEKVSLYNDCVHWCLPGPIDTLNDFLLHLLKIEDGVETSYDQHNYKLLSSYRKMMFF